MTQGRVQRWSRRRATVVLFGAVAASVSVGLAANAVTKSVAAHLAVDVISLLVMLWALVLFFRVLLRESSEAAAKNPRPW
jgi:hypothetical protein